MVKTLNKSQICGLFEYKIYSQRSAHVVGQSEGLITSITSILFELYKSNFKF